MRFRLATMLGVFLGLAVSGFGPPGVRAAEGTPMALRLESPAFPKNGSIPSVYTCEGNGISPTLAWSGIPEGTKSLALIVDDPDAPDPAAPKTTWVHWVLYDIPPATAGLPESAAPPPGAREGINDWKQPGYRGPCPPIGKHRYFFKLYALDTTLNLPGTPAKAQLEQAMQGHILGQATLIGAYEKAKR